MLFAKYVAEKNYHFKIYIKSNKKNVSNSVEKTWKAVQGGEEGTWGW